MMKISPVKVVLGAIAYLIIAQVMHTVSSMLTMSYYMDSNYYAVWSKIMMPAAGAPPMSFYYYSLTFGFVIGVIFSAIYSKRRETFKGDFVHKGLMYGSGLFLVVGIPFFLTTYLMINLPLSLLIYWLLIDGLLTYLLGGIAIAWLNK